MEIGEKEAEKLRNELHNLDIRDGRDREVYYNRLYHIIASGEGFEPKAYKDSKKLLTIGYGFNMDRGDASRNEWNNIFKNSINFDDAKNKKIEITRDQAKMLKKYGVNVREKELAKIYDPYWDKMRLNERAILTDLYYQSPKLAKNGTRFASNLKEYYKTGNKDYFELAVNEVKKHSSYSKNPLEIPGLQNRNNIRAIILDSRKNPLYSNPQDQLIPEDKKLKVILGKTIISREISAQYPKSNQLAEGTLGDYYIWRTCMDNRVRAKHVPLEGRVFKHSDDMLHPKEDYGCRCEKENLPIHAEIIEPEEQAKKMLKHDNSNNANTVYILPTAPKKEYCA